MTSTSFQFDLKGFFFKLLNITTIILSNANYFTNTKYFFYIHGSVHRESNWIIVQQDATVFSLLYFCRQLNMFRVLTPIIRSSYSCNYSFWHRSTAV